MCKTCNTIISLGQLLQFSVVCYISFCYDLTTEIIHHIHSLEMKKGIASTHIANWCMFNTIIDLAM